MATSTSDKVYNLRLVGGNEATVKQVLCTAGDGTLEIQSKSSTSAAGLYILSKTGSSTTIRSTTNTTHYLILQGPSGKGEFKLQESSITEPQGIGSQILHDDWLVIEEGGRLLLRYREDEGESHWVASQSGGERWTVWWYSPSPANEDLVTFVDVEVELVEVEGQRKREI